ncbi:MAG: RNA polymerase sigma factor [Opitutaceae bacterium]|nr:RNA polymerase sigma factor [Opitutaceae bacterium]
MVIDSAPSISSLPVASPEELNAWFDREIAPLRLRLRAYLNARYRLGTEADDVLQEACLRLWQLQQAGRVTRARALLYAIARNLAVDLIRRRLRAPFADVTREQAWAVPDERDTVETIARTQECRLLAEAIELLPRRGREVTRLRRLEGRRAAETARELGLAESTVEYHLGKAQQRCAAYLREMGVGASGF